MKLLTLRRLFLTALSSGISVTTVFAATGARQLADLNPGVAGSFPSNFVSFGGAVYFSAYSFDTGIELWRHTSSGVTLAADINPTADDIGFGKEGNDSLPSWLTPYGGELYFSAFHPGSGGELWRFDGSQATRVSDINPDQNPENVKPVQNSSWPNQLVALGDSLYFSANSRTSPENYELWRYTAGAVQQVANLHPDSGTNYSSYPTGLTPFNGALYFMADDGAHGWELWRHDGVETKLFDLNPGGAESSSYPQGFAALGNELFFPAYTAEHGFELWKTDGTTATVAADVQAGPESSYPRELTAFNGAMYFQGFESGAGYELRKVEGGQVTLAAEINPTGDSYPKNLTVFGNLLVFAANDGINGWELWKYDGVSASIVTNLNASGDAFPEELTVFEGALYFVATTPETGYEIWKFDGSAVTVAAEVNPAGDSYPRNLTVANGQLYFSAAEAGFSDWEPWVLDAASTPVNQPPTVTLTAPAQGAAFLTTDSITISANASDDRGVSRVQFYRDGTLLGTEADAPYSISVTLPAGTHSITAEAYDASELSGISATVTITVSEPAVNQPPTVALTAPVAGATYLTSDAVTISADASDDSGVVRVEFYAGDSFLGADTTAPYNLSWSFTAGTHALTARAFDTDGLSANSGTVTITVNEPAVNQAPTVILTAPVQGATYLTTEIVAISANASDDSEVVRVEFYADGVSLGADTTAPYSITASFAAGAHPLTARAFDADGLSGNSAAVTITVTEPTTNQPPTITLSSAPAGQTLTAPATVTLAAAASDSDGIAEVQFFRGGSPIGSDTTAPYQVIVSDLQPGVHVFSAVARDNHGATASSTTVEIRVTDPPILTVARSGGLIDLNATVTPGLSYATQTSSDLVSWTTVHTSTATSGTISFTENASSALRFYRVVAQ